MFKNNVAEEPINCPWGKLQKKDINRHGCWKIPIYDNVKTVLEILKEDCRTTQWKFSTKAENSVP